jgi:type I restriction enzyme M protein
MNNFCETANFIWPVADLVHMEDKQAEYSRVVLPFTILRRLDCVVDAIRPRVFAKLQAVEITGIQNIDPVLNKESGQTFHNQSKFDFRKLIGDAARIFEKKVHRLDSKNLLFAVVKQLQEIDLRPNAINNMQMGRIFDELIRKFTKLSNKIAGSIPPGISINVSPLCSPDDVCADILKPDEKTEGMIHQIVD